MESSQGINQSKTRTYLSFLHSVQYGKPSLVCDFMELYRYLIDDVLIDFCRKMNPKDFIVKTENSTRKKKGKREYLNNIETRELMTKLEVYFESMVEVPRIKVGKRQALQVGQFSGARLLWFSLCPWGCGKNCIVT